MECCILNKRGVGFFVLVLGNFLNRKFDNFFFRDIRLWRSRRVGLILKVVPGHSQWKAPFN